MFQEPTKYKNMSFQMEIEKWSFDVEMNESHLYKSYGLIPTDILQAEQPKNNYYLGALLFILSSLWCSVMVCFAKVTFKLNPELTAYDLLLVRGIILTTVFSSYAVYKRINIFDFGGTPVLCLTTWFSDSVTIFVMLSSMKYISAAKAAMIVQCNPVIIVLLAGLVLNEVVSKQDKVAVFLMILGWIVLSFHQTHSPENIEKPFLGYTLAFTTVVLIAFVCIGIRKMNQNVHFLIFPYYFSVGLLILCFFAYILFDDQVNFNRYNRTELLTNAISSFGSIGTLVFMSQAFKYADAAQLTPLGSIQSVTNFMAEYFILKYNFGLTDFMGASILMVAFMVPLIAKGWFKA